MKTVAYVILAGLLLKPRSGYDLARWIERVTDHFFAVGHSSIYPALAHLEQQGLVTHEVVASARGPQRKVYALSQAGRAALLAWVEGPAAETQVRDEQLVKALCYPFLSEERALARIHEVKARYAERAVRYREMERTLQGQVRDGDVSREAYLGMLLTLRRGIGAAESYVQWCDDAAELLASAAPPDAAGESRSDRAQALRTATERSTGDG
jgi:PadR family transcriptional regulator AphA